VSTITQRRFSAGEIAPTLYAGVDLVKYSTGLRTLRNAYVKRHGGLDNRPGTAFVGEVKDSTKAVRLIPFVFNSNNTYMLEFGNLYIRFIKDGAYITLTSQAITAATNASPCVVTYTGADNYANGDIVQIAGITGAIGTYLNGRDFKVAGVDAGANTFQLNYLDGTAVNSTSFGSYTSGGTVAEVYTLTTTYLEADLPLLKFAQSADYLYIVHTGYVPRTLARTSDTSWAIDNFTTGSPVTLNGIVQTFTTSGANGSAVSYALTALDENGQECEVIMSVGTATVATTGAPVTVSWSLKAGSASPYQWAVYKKTTSSGVFGFMALIDGGDSQIVDNGIPPDVSSIPPQYRILFDATGEYPACVTISQQRLILASSVDEPEKVWASQVGSYRNFNVSTPLENSDSIIFSVAGKKVTDIRNLLDLDKLILLSSEYESTCLGDQNGSITPFDINLKTSSQNGCSTLAPLVIDNTALYVQARGSVVRDLGFDYQADGYKGNEVSLFSSHLVDGYTLDDWSYQTIPHSIAWMVRGDGVLLSLTYVRDQQILGWATHDFDGGLVENVCVVPEGEEDAVYVVVKRTVNSRSVRYIERLTQRRVDAIEDMIFMDSSLTYDGTNTSVMTMDLSGGTTWAYDETLTLTASAAYFVAGDVGNQIILTDAATGDVVRFTIVAYSSSTVVTGRPDITVPTALRLAITNWSKAVDEVTGLWHLEGKTVSVLGDGNVVGSPYNEQYDIHTITNGTLLLSNSYSVLKVGLPYISDIESLDIDTDQGETLADKAMLIDQVTFHIEESGGIFVGGAPPTDDAVDPLQGLYELKIRQYEDVDDPTALQTGKASINIDNSWNSNGRVFIRQVDPLPMSISAISPSGKIPYRKMGS